MRERIVLACFVAFLTACGSRSDLEGVPASSGMCAPGAAPVALATGLASSADAFSSGTFMGSDGKRVWVAQPWSRPFVWSIDVGGGARSAVYDDVPDGDDGSVYELFVTQDRVFFNAATWQKNDFGPPYNPVTWTWDSVSTSGGSVTAIDLPLKVEGVDSAGERGFAMGLSNTLPIVAVSLADGSTSPFASPDITGFELDWLRVTGAFVHLMLQELKPAPVVLRDMRIDVATGAVHDTVPFEGSAAGPTDLCGFEVNGGSYDVVCLSDSASTPRVLAKDLPMSTALAGQSEVLYVDASWVYVTIAGAAPHLSRFSLVDGHEERLMDGVSTLAATGFGACLYAMTWTTSSTTLWRVSR